MILIELEDQRPGGFRLEFHPRVTIVAGLSDSQRGELAKGLAAALTGAESSLRIEVDVAGVPQRLTPRLIASLGIRPDPIGSVAGQDWDDQTQAVSGLERVDSFLEARLYGTSSVMSEKKSSLAAARSKLKEARDHAAGVARQLYEALNSDQTFDQTELEQTQLKYSQARQRVADIHHALLAATPPEDVAAERLERLHQIRERIEVRLVELGQLLAPSTVDAEIIKRALRRAEELIEPAEDVDKEWEAAAEAGASTALSAPSQLRQPAELADLWVEVSERLEHSRTHAAPKWLMQMIRGDFEDANARAAALRSQQADGIDVREPLRRAERALVDAQAAWDELQHGSQATIAALEVEREDVRAEAIAVLRRDPGDEALASELREAQRRIDAHALGQAVSPRGELARVLVMSGIHATEDDAIEVATGWLEQHRQNEIIRSQLRQELAAATLDLRDVKAEILALESRDLIEDEDPEELLRQELAETEQVVAEEGSRLAGLRRVAARQKTEEQIAGLELAYKVAIEGMESAGRRVDYFVELAPVGVAADVLPASFPEPDKPAHLRALLAESPEAAEAAEEESRVAAEAEAPGLSESERAVVSGRHDVNSLVLARAAELRRAGSGEAVPLVLDAAFDDLPAGLASRVFDLLPRIGNEAQIVYLASNELAGRWVEDKSEVIAAVVRTQPVI